MDVFFVVLGLLLLAFPIMAIAALVKTIGIRGQLRQVEVRLAALERGATAPARGHTGGARAGIFRARAATANRAVGRAPGRAGCGERTRAGHRRILARRTAAAPRTGATRGARA